MELEIEVLWHTDETRARDEMGQDYDVKKLEHRTITFYRIDAISPNMWDDENEFCNIHSGGEKWISPFTYEQVKELITKNKQQ